MSDLSRLLDDVYGTGGEPAAASASRATETAMVIPGWLPGTPPGTGADRVPVAPDPVDALEAILDLGVAERHSEVAGRPEPGVVVVRVPDPPPPTWTLRDDDILPARSSRRRLRRRR